MYDRKLKIGKGVVILSLLRKAGTYLRSSSMCANCKQKSAEPHEHYCTMYNVYFIWYQWNIKGHSSLQNLKTAFIYLCSAELVLRTRIQRLELRSWRPLHQIQILCSVLPDLQIKNRMWLVLRSWLHQIQMYLDLQIVNLLIVLHRTLLSVN